jgi:hypothetical protein
MLQVSLEKQLFVCLLNRESFDRVRPKEGVCFKHVEMQIVDDAVGTHRIVSDAEPRVV